MENILLLFLAIPLFALVGGFIYYLVQDSKDRHVARYNAYHRYNPDQNGNYPAFFNPDNGINFTINPGNPNYPQVQNFNLNNQEVTPAKPRQPVRPIVINGGGYRVVSSELPKEPEQIEQEFEAKQLPEQAVQDEPAQNFYLLLSAAKQEGRGKIGAIENITGVKRGGSKAFRYWSEIWDNIQVNNEGERLNQAI